MGSSKTTLNDSGKFTSFDMQLNLSSQCNTEKICIMLDLKGLVIDSVAGGWNGGYRGKYLKEMFNQDVLPSENLWFYQTD